MTVICGANFSPVMSQSSLWMKLLEEGAGNQDNRSFFKGSGFKWIVGVQRKPPPAFSCLQMSFLCHRGTFLWHILCFYTIIALPSPNFEIISFFSYHKYVKFKFTQEMTLETFETKYLICWNVNFSMLNILFTSFFQ